MAQRIGNDEAAPRGQEITAGGIDGVTLLPPGLRPINQQCKIDVIAADAALAAVPQII
jgi:hypothetical protein